MCLRGCDGGRGGEGRWWSRVSVDWDVKNAAGGGEVGI